MANRKANGGGALGFRRQTYVREAVVQTERREVAFMEPLHHDDDRPSLLVVQPRRERPAEEGERRVTLGVAVGLVRVVWVVDDDAVPRVVKKLMRPLGGRTSGVPRGVRGIAPGRSCNFCFRKNE